MRFSAPVLDTIDKSLVLGIRAGTKPHRIIGIWAVVVERRVFIRSWGVKPDGWYRTFVEEPHGVMQIGKRKLRVRAVRAVRTRSERQKAAVDRAYAAKYKTPASHKWVRGFKVPRRRNATMELVPG